MTDFEQRLTRRRFIAASGALATGLMAMGCAGSAVYRVSLQSGRLAIDPKTYPELDKPGGAVMLRGNGLEEAVILVRIEGQNYKALSAACTHLGCTVRPSGQFLACPCHGSTFALTGEVVRGPAERPLKTYPVHVSQQGIDIDLTQ